MTAYRPLSSAIRSTDDIDWPDKSIPLCCPSIIYKVFLCDDYHPLFLVVWYSAAYYDDRHGWTMIACDAWRQPSNLLRLDQIFPVHVPLKLLLRCRIHSTLGSTSLVIPRSSWVQFQPGAQVGQPYRHLPGKINYLLTAVFCGRRRYNSDLYKFLDWFIFFVSMDKPGTYLVEQCIHYLAPLTQWRWLRLWNLLPCLLHQHFQDNWDRILASSL